MTSAEKQRLWRLRNPEKAKESLRRYKEKYPERIAETQRRFRLKNKEKLIEQRKLKRKSNIQLARMLDKKYRSTTQGRFRLLKGGAKTRGIEFKITYEEYLKIISNPCTYCGDTEARLSIDRIDNNTGYILENSTSCCPSCNYMKRAMSVKDFLEHVEKINNFSRK